MLFPAFSNHGLHHLVMTSWPSVVIEPLSSRSAFPSPRLSFPHHADLNPMPTEEIVQMFNELRSDLVLVYELKQAHANCEYEQQMLRHRYEALLKAGGEAGHLGEGPGAEGSAGPGCEDLKAEAKEQVIDVVGAPLTPNSVSTEHAVRSGPVSSPIPCPYTTWKPWENQASPSLLQLLSLPKVAFI